MQRISELPGVCFSDITDARHSAAGGLGGLIPLKLPVLYQPQSRFLLLGNLVARHLPAHRHTISLPSRLIFVTQHDCFGTKPDRQVAQTLTRHTGI